MPYFRRLLGWVPWHWPAPVFWSVVGGLALVVGGGVVASVASLQQAVDQWGELRRVPVAVRVLDAGDVVTARDIAVARLPRRLVPYGSRAAANWVGRTVVWPVVPGEVLLEARLAPGGVQGAAALLPKGARAVAVPAGPGGRPPLRIGDRVDVLATVAFDSEGGEPTFVVAERALVIAVDDASDVVTVAVPASIAPRLAHAVATAAVTLALTSAR